MVYGNVLDLGVPSDATVTNAKTNFVSTSSAAGLQIKGDGTTDGTLQLNCSQNSHGIKLKSPAHSASASYTLTFPTTDGSANEFLKTDGSGVLSWASAGGANTPYFEAYVASNQTLADNTNTKINFDTETYDSGGMYDTTNKRFLPTTAGKYLIYFSICFSAGGVDRFHNCEGQVRFNGNIHKKYYFEEYDNYMSYAKMTTGSTIMTFNGSSDYVEMWGSLNVTSSTGHIESGAYTTFGGFKIIE